MGTQDRNGGVMNWKEQYAKLVSAMENEQYIYDDNGCFWYFDGERIRLALADVEAPNDAMENGYYAENFQDGIRALREGGYIS